MKKSDLETAALNQKVRADRLEEREADLEHALNLLINEAVEWFGTYNEGDDKRHHFGVGVAMNVPIEDKLRAAVAGRRKEHRVIIFWKTEFLLPAENRKHQYLTIYSLEDFERLPKNITAAGSAVGENSAIAMILENAIRTVDEAVKSYLKSRAGLHLVM